MKIFSSSIFRSLCAIIVGALLVKYREQTVTWITVAIGVIFLVSGIVSVTAWISTKRKSGSYDMDIYDANGNQLTYPKPQFPIVGLGSLFFGGMLAMFPDSFINGLTFVLSIILILGALSQFLTLAAANRFAKIGIVWWIIPSLVLLVGLVAILKPSLIASAPLLVLGWCIMIYGVIDLIDSIKIHQCRSQNPNANRSKNDATAVEIKEEK